MNMKKNIILELRGLAELGECSKKLVKAVEAGEFDADIDEMVCMSVTEGADEIMSLARIRGI
jgi:hypothetical protein